MTVRARCPVCGRLVPVFVDQGEEIYECHGANLRDSGGCEAGGWIVESDERLVDRPAPRPAPPAAGLGLVPFVSAARWRTLTDLCRQLDDRFNHGTGPKREET